MIQVLRIENEDGIGIFHGGFAFSVCREVATRHGKFPNPHQEGLKMNGQWFCAYKTIEQIQEWIMPDELRMLPECGYRVYLLTVTNYQIGNYQVIFTKDSIIDRKDVTELFI